MLESFSLNSLRRKYYSVTSTVIPYKKARWVSTSFIASFYLYRVYGLEYNVITYLIAFYLLQLLVGYFTPKGLEEIDEDEDSETIDGRVEVEVDLLMSEDFDIEELNIDTEKPLIASLAEIEIWFRVTLSFVLGLTCSVFKIFEIEVFWPLLMVYFILLVGYTVHKIVKKMKKYRYTLSDFNKKVQSFEV